ncbi:hypothetical protein HMPREF0208_04803 [Citrobacter koseri]|uniref:Uncharacterized protein n=1 Tax=Salmonella bongori N268-08 TaxID=1197719 RepID=S5NGD9_SALBN|nr:hypothetical protein A464_4498 [Salmonella bongori N268-08]KWZ95196.1 hypothetical protein HMPREF3220_04196 [Citrobacter koseri]KXA02512.1 hypothetical protein HMPREF3207_02374 [Citrobacter koseri]KXB39399.1 hypothetical protein HMPREF0208_04803 [Citrobacter koseri]
MSLSSTFAGLSGVILWFRPGYESGSGLFFSSFFIVFKEQSLCQ